MHHTNTCINTHTLLSAFSADRAGPVTSSSGKAEKGVGGSVEEEAWAWSSPTGQETNGFDPVPVTASVPLWRAVTQTLRQLSPGHLWDPVLGSVG